jgi:hypothetical protein
MGSIAAARRDLIRLKGDQSSDSIKRLIQASYSAFAAALGTFQAVCG